MVNLPAVHSGVAVLPLITLINKIYPGTNKGVSQEPTGAFGWPEPSTDCSNIGANLCIWEVPAIQWSRDGVQEEPKVRSPHPGVYPNLPRGQFSFSLLCSPCVMKAVSLLQPRPCLHPSLGFGLFVWSAQISQGISPWRNMLHVPCFNWHGLVPCTGLSASHPVWDRHVRAHQTSHLTDGLTVSSQGGCCNRLTGSAKGWVLGPVPWCAAGCGGCCHSLTGMPAGVGRHPRAFAHWLCSTLLFSCHIFLGELGRKRGFLLLQSCSTLAGFSLLFAESLGWL